MEDHKKYIFICTGDSCKEENSKDLYKYLKSELKERELRSRFEVIRTRCMDMCKLAPNAIMDNRVYNRITRKDLLKMIREDP